MIDRDIGDGAPGIVTKIASLFRAWFAVELGVFGHQAGFRVRGAVEKSAALHGARSPEALSLFRAVPTGPEFVKGRKMIRWIGEKRGVLGGCEHDLMLILIEDGR